MIYMSDVLDCVLFGSIDFYVFIMLGRDADILNIVNIIICDEEMNPYNLIS